MFELCIYQLATAYATVTLRTDETVHDDKQRIETVREFSVVYTFSDSSEMFTTDAVDCAGGNCFSMNTAVAQMSLRSPETDSNVVRRAQANAEAKQRRWR